MIELALPAGSLETALTAFVHGADAVYFGLKEFSARKGAVNFSFEDLSKIRRYSLDNGKKTYITINTLIDDASVTKVTDLLDEVAFYGTDGIIIQDLGIADIIRRHYPSLPLHGSTQLAVHTSDGVKALQDLGFERVVLSRELTLKEIEKIRKECPDIELKVFIHGALCYGFSGLCSASAIKCSRSANGGECAQICRSWFTDEKTGEKGYFFSMEDMMAGEKLKVLNDMGIDSAKVEGRLKAPEYVAAVTEYYRSILDKGRATLEEEDAVRTTFLRKSSDGYFSYKADRPSLLSGGYPGHMGLFVGKVEEEYGRDRIIRTEVPVEDHDGLQYFIENTSGLPEAVKFSANVRAGTKNTLRLRIDTPDRLLGKEIWKISDSTRREKTQSSSIPLYRKSVDITVTLTDSEMTAEALGKKVSKEMAMEESKTPKDIQELLKKTFSESGTSKYTLKNLNYRNSSSLKYPFIPPSFLKDLRRSFYQELDTVKPEKTVIPQPAESNEGFILPPRHLLSGDLPWSAEPKELNGRTYITLPPVTFNEEKTYAEALESIKGKTNVTIGLNNIGQIRFAKAHTEYDYFADIWFYVPNRFTASVLKREIPSLIGGYLWFERDEYSAWPWKPTVTDYEPPFFISRTCYRHDALGLPCKGCSKHEDFTVSQAPDTFTVKVRQCLTVMERKR
ncbi:MAG: U32 family peptidase [Bullifex sp.]